MGNNRRFGIKHIWADSSWKRVVLQILLSDRSQSVYKHRLDIKETFCRNGVTNESLWRVDQLMYVFSRFQECVIFRVLRQSACSRWRFTSNFAVHAQCGKISLRGHLPGGLWVPPTRLSTEVSKYWHMWILHELQMLMLLWFSYHGGIKMLWFSGCCHLFFCFWLHGYYYFQVLLMLGGFWLSSFLCLFVDWLCLVGVGVLLFCFHIVFDWSAA